MKKQIANIISSTRIVISIVLFFFSEINLRFLILYCYCGVTDMVDGAIARKLDAESMTGAILDTVGDVLLYCSMGKIIILSKIVPLWTYLWMASALVGLIISAFIARARFNKFYFVHTLFGKIFGGVLLLLPLGITIINNNSIYFAILCATTSIAAIESIILQMMTKFPHDNVISIKKAIADLPETDMVEIEAEE